MKKVNTKEAFYTESKSLRNDAVETANVDFLDKIKAVQYLTGDMIISIEQIANYYEVSKKAVEIVIQRNRDEFEEDCMKVLVGDELKEFKIILTSSDCGSQNEGQGIGSKARSFTILTKRSLLRVGLIMTNCAMASKIRNYLLNLEEVSTQEQKAWAVQREAGKIERKRMTSAISKYIPEGGHKRFAYPNYTNMIYKVLFNKDAKAMKAERNMKDNDALRDSFTGMELSNVGESETIVTALIALGFGFDSIKLHLQTKYGKLLSQDNK